MADEDAACEESYKACMAARHARAVKGVAEAAPWETVKAIAERVGVSPRTVDNVKAELLQIAQGCVDCNSDDPPPPRTPLLRLRSLYKPDIPYWSQRPVKAVETALNGCNAAQLAYIFAEVTPVFELNLKSGNVK